MNNTKISLIAAIDENRGLGKDNHLLFKIPEDLKRFKKLTSGHPVIMGRKTFESIGRPLPNRLNIVITRDADFHPDGVEVVHSLGDALEAVPKDPESNLGRQSAGEIFIIGGGQIFTQAIDRADKLYLTVVKGNYNADVFFPDYSAFTKVVHKEEHESDGFSYTFLDLEKNNPSK